MPKKNYIIFESGNPNPALLYVQDVTSYGDTDKITIPATAVSFRMARGNYKSDKLCQKHFSLLPRRQALPNYILALNFVEQRLVDAALDKKIQPIADLLKNSGATTLARTQDACNNFVPVRPQDIVLLLGNQQHLTLADIVEQKPPARRKKRLPEFA